MRKKNDVLLKSAFEESFPDLLRFFFKGAETIFDMHKGFEFMDKELYELFPELDKKGGSRFVDMLVKSFLINGNEEWILIHLEIQHKNDKNFPKRMFQYFYRIYDRYNVPITAVAIFTGESVTNRPTHFEHRFLGTEIRYEYNAYHIFDHNERELLSMHNLFALVILAAQKALLMGKIPDEDLGQQRLMIARTLVQSQRYDSEKIRRFLFFLKTFIHIENPKINFNFDKEIDFLTNKHNAMGIIETIKMITREEGREVGREEGREVGREEGIKMGLKEASERKDYAFVKNLLLNTDFETARIAALTGVTEAYVSKIRSEISS